MFPHVSWCSGTEKHGLNRLSCLVEQLAQYVPSRLVVLWNRETRLKKTELPGGTVGTKCSLTSRGALELNTLRWVTR
jgi:hypothetical protein